MSCSYPGLDPARYVGDPVDVTTGANVDVAGEFRLAGTHFVWNRYYNSHQCRWQRPLGWGHTHEYDHTLRLNLDGIEYIGPQGHSIQFNPLTRDNSQTRSGGFTLIRVSERVHHLLPSRSASRFIFEFGPGSSRADLAELRFATGSLRFRHGARGLEQIAIGDGRQVALTLDTRGLVRALRLIERSAREPRPLISYEYDEEGNLTSGVDAYGSTFSFIYDEHRRMRRRTDRNGYSMLFEYDVEGRCTASGGEDGVRRVELRYLPLEMVTKVIEADGGEWTYFYNASRQVTQIIDPAGGARRFQYAESGARQAEIDPLGNVTRYIHDVNGQALARISPIGIPYGLDEPPPPPFRPHDVAASPREFELGAWTAPAGPDGGANGFRALKRDGARLLTEPLPHEVSATREDDLGKALTRTTRAGDSSHRRYDGNGNLVRYRDFSGATYDYQYASWNHLVREIDPEGRAIESRYTPREYLASVTDAGGTEQAYGYNLLGKVAEVYRHGELLETYQHDAAGNIVLKRDRFGAPLLRFEIGPGNLIAARHLASGDSHRFDHDAAGRMTNATSRDADVQFAYDALGRRIKDVRNGRGVEHAFDGEERRTTILGRFALDYRQRPDGSLRITDCTGATHKVSFATRETVYREHAHGSSEYVRFDRAGRICTRIARTSHSPAGYWARRYRWTADGDLVGADDNTLGSMRWQYDASHRLRRAMLPNGGTEEYSYDAAGNLLRAPGLTGVSLRTGNRLASANGDSFEYDGRDHLARRVSARDTHSYAYDSRGMLLRVERNGETFWDATYDALGRRVRKTSPLGSTEYFWDADQLAAEIDEHGRVRVYVYLDRLALAPFMFVDYRSVDADPASGLAFFIFSNQLGAPLLVEDVNGRIAWRCTYTAYGAAQIDPGSRIACHLRFPGHYFDGETGLHYNRFRYYSPELGRYLQADPEGIAGGLNLYAYTRNPLVDVDVRGLNCGAHGRGTKAKPDCEDCRDADPALREALEPTEPGAIKSPEELRAETARREAVLRATLSQDERGPCVSMVLDQETGQGFAGINRDAPPDDPHPIIQDRLDNPPEGGWRNPDEPGSHSEIHALDQALKARQERANAAADAAGIPRPPDPPISTDGLLIDNQRSRGANKGTPMPCCPNCTHITGGADPSQPGYIPSQAGKDPVGHTGGTPGAGGSSGDAGSGAAEPPGGSGGSGSQADHVQNGAMGGGSGGEE